MSLQHTFQTPPLIIMRTIAADERGVETTKWWLGVGNCSHSTGFVNSPSQPCMSSTRPPALHSLLSTYFSTVTSLYDYITRIIALAPAQRRVLTEHDSVEYSEFLHSTQIGTNEEPQSRAVIFHPATPMEPMYQVRFSVPKIYAVLKLHRSSNALR
jgi:hypothetical protein